MEKKTKAVPLPEQGRVSNSCSGQLSWFSKDWIINVLDRDWRPKVSKLLPSMHVNSQELHSDHSVKWQSPSSTKRGGRNEQRLWWMKILAHYWTGKIALNFLSVCLPSGPACVALGQPTLAATFVLFMGFLPFYGIDNHPSNWPWWRIKRCLFSRCRVKL